MARVHLVITLLQSIAQLSCAARTSLFSSMPAAPPRAVHVTRLHRYDHAGLDSMLQAESTWEAVPAKDLDADAIAKYLKKDLEKALRQVVARRAQLSEPQAEWLKKHHEEIREALLVQQTSTEEVQAAQERASKFHVAQGKVTGPTATGLSSLGSQYVGPIGVGTVQAPQGCRRTPGVALTYLPHGSRPEPPTGAEGSMLQRECHAEDAAQVWMVFDTGSTNLWVASDLCDGACAQNGRVRYNHSLSQTYMHPTRDDHVKVEFGTGAVSGPLGVDDFHIGPFTVYNQTFGMIQKEDGSIFRDLPFEGILGLALPQMSFHGVTPVFDNIVKQKALKNNAFAFYFSLDNPAANAVFWGGTDSKFHQGPIKYFKVTDDMYWSLNLKSFSIGGKTLLGDEPTAQAAGGSILLQGPQPKAIVDTGTTFFTAESDIFHQILDALPHVPCDKMTEESHPPMLFQLEGASGEVHDFKLTHDQYMVSTNRDTLSCLPAFMQLNLPKGHGPGVIFGEVFLRHYFSVFDRGNGAADEAKVGLAPAAHGEHVDQHLKAVTKHQPTFKEARRM